MKSSRILLDTQAFLWFVFDDDRISRRASALIGSSRVHKILSVVSLWEIAIKVSLDKLSLGMPYEEFLTAHVQSRDLDLLPIRLPHLVSCVNLPFHHRDPFDRLLIAQGLSERLEVVTADPRFEPYGVAVLW